MNRPRLRPPRRSSSSTFSHNAIGLLALGAVILAASYLAGWWVESGHLPTDRLGVPAATDRSGYHGTGRERKMIVGPYRVEGWTEIDDDWLVRLQGSATLRELILEKSPITDRGLANLADLPTLERLELIDIPVTDAGLAPLGSCKKLQNVVLEKTAVEGAGLAHLAELSELRCLFLNDSPVGDVGLAHVAKLTRLEMLSLSGTRVTSAGLAQI